MKITWEADDIRPGRRVRKPGTSEAHILGYVSRDCGDHRPGQRYTIISLADGLVWLQADDKQEIATALSEEGFMPVELVGEVLSPSELQSVVARDRAA